MDRNGIIDAIVTLLRASAKTNVAAVANNNIQYGEKDPRQTNVVIADKEVWVGPLFDDVTPATLSKEQHSFQVSIVVFVKGKYGLTDKRTAVSIAEDCEQILLENRDLPSPGGVIRGPIQWDLVSFFGEEFSGNFAALQFPVDKMTTVF